MFPLPETAEPRIPGTGSRGGESGAPRRAPFSIPGGAPADLCPHFGPCGGCTLLDVAYAETLARKRERIESALRGALPGEGIRVDPVLPDPHPFHYRNKAIYPLGLRAERGGRGERLVAGFYRRGSHAIVDVHECQIQDPSLTEMAVLCMPLKTIRVTSGGQGYRSILTCTFSASIPVKLAIDAPSPYLNTS